MLQLCPWSNANCDSTTRCNPALSDIQIKDKLDAGRALKVLIVQQNKALFTNYFTRHLKWPEPSSWRSWSRQGNADNQITLQSNKCPCVVQCVQSMYNVYKVCTMCVQCVSNSQVESCCFFKSSSGGGARRCDHHLWYAGCWEEGTSSKCGSLSRIDAQGRGQSHNNVPTINIAIDVYQTQAAIIWRWGSLNQLRTRCNQELLE